MDKKHEEVLPGVPRRLASESVSDPRGPPTPRRPRVSQEPSGTYRNDTLGVTPGHQSTPRPVLRR